MTTHMHTFKSWVKPINGKVRLSSSEGMVFLIFSGINAYLKDWLGNGYFSAVTLLRILVVVCLRDMKITLKCPSMPNAHISFLVSKNRISDKFRVFGVMRMKHQLSKIKSTN